MLLGGWVSVTEAGNGRARRWSGSGASAYSGVMTDAERDTRIASLEAALTELRRELAQAQRPRIRSMRSTGRCPSCGGGRLLHFRAVKDVGHGHLHDLSLQKDYSKWLGLKDSNGPLEVFACRGCRLVEWSAATLDDVVPDGQTVVELVAAEDPDPNEGPYR